MADQVDRMAGWESGDKESCDGSYNPEYKRAAAGTPSRDYSRHSHSCSSLNDRFYLQLKIIQSFQVFPQDNQMPF